MLWIDEKPVVMVPDLIMNLEIDTGEPITTEMLRYGQRVAVIGLPVHDLMKNTARTGDRRAEGFRFPGIDLRAAGDAAGGRIGGMTMKILRTIHAEDLEDIAIGGAVLGTGGGGDPCVGKLMAQEAIRRHGPVKLVDVEALAHDALVVPVCMMGAPTVMTEKCRRATS